MLTLNIPDKYAQARGGWATNHTMKTVYQHTMQSQQSAVDMAIDNYFYNLIEKMRRRRLRQLCDISCCISFFRVIFS